MINQYQVAGPAAELNVAEGPDHGPPLLLLHGVTRRWSDFLPLIPAYSCRWKVLALDFRGHGRSGPADGAYLVTDYVDDAVAVLQQGLGGPAVLYGHSLGGMVALAAASRVPSLVRGLILEDPPFATMGRRMSETPFESYFRGVKEARDAGSEVPALARRLADIIVGRQDRGKVVRLGQLRDGASLRLSARCLSQADPAVLEAVVSGRWLDGYDLPELAGRLDCPVLLLQADAASGGMLTDADVKLLMSTISDCTLIRFPKTGHLIHWLRCEETLRVTNSFLESLLER